MFRLGIQIPRFTEPEVRRGHIFEDTLGIALAAEASGFDAILVMDHFYQIPRIGARDEPMLESYTLLGALAARTKSARLGTLVTGVTYRNPAHLAKMVTTLDVISNGRAMLGIGAAWNDDEHAGLGFRFPPTAERFERLEEAVQICRLMFREPTPSFAGRHYQIQDALNVPAPVQADGPPILIGGTGERRTLKLVAQYADACNLVGSHGEIQHKLAVLDRHCEDVGRDPASLTRTRLAIAIVGSTQAEATARANAMATAAGMPPGIIEAIAFVGTPDAIADQTEEYRAIGIDALVLHVPGGPEAIGLLGPTLSARWRSPSAAPNRT